LLGVDDEGRGVVPLRSRSFVLLRSRERERDDRRFRRLLLLLLLLSLSRRRRSLLLFEVVLFRSRDRDRDDRRRSLSRLVRDGELARYRLLPLLLRLLSPLLRRLLSRLRLRLRLRVVVLPLVRSRDRFRSRLRSRRSRSPNDRSLPLVPPRGVFDDDPRGVVPLPLRDEDGLEEELDDDGRGDGATRSLDRDRLLLLVVLVLLSRLVLESRSLSLRALLVDTVALCKGEVLVAAEAEEASSFEEDATCCRGDADTLTDDDLSISTLVDDVTDVTGDDAFVALPFVDDVDVIPAPSVVDAVDDDVDGDGTFAGGSDIEATVIPMALVVLVVSLGLRRGNDGPSSFSSIVSMSSLDDTDTTDALTTVDTASLDAAGFNALSVVPLRVVVLSSASNNEASIGVSCVNGALGIGGVDTTPLLLPLIAGDNATRGAGVVGVKEIGVVGDGMLLVLDALKLRTLPPLDVVESILGADDVDCGDKSAVFVSLCLPRRAFFVPDDPLLLPDDPAAADASLLRRLLRGRSGAGISSTPSDGAVDVT
jgi:hypothetical protein